MDIRRAFSIAWLAFGLLALLLSANALGHPGGLDRNGCQTNRKTGDYHCH
ncbi:TPA: YHYH domain-containing protein [Stenotrophomonas maltophilia]